MLSPPLEVVDQGLHGHTSASEDRGASHHLRVHTDYS